MIADVISVQHTVYKTGFPDCDGKTSVSYTRHSTLISLLNNMVYCSAIDCSYGTGTKRKKNAKIDKVKFHPFPEDNTLRKSWLHNMKRHDSDLPKNPVLCSLHFKEEMFVRDLQVSTININTYRFCHFRL